MNDDINQGPQQPIKPDAAVEAWVGAIAAPKMHGQHTGFGVNSTTPNKVLVEAELFLLLYQMENASITDEDTQYFFKHCKRKKPIIYFENN